MGKVFYSIPGTRVTNSDDGPPRPAPFEPRSDPKMREFYAARDERRRRDGDRVASGFTSGDEVMWNGERAVVEGVEYDAHTGKESTWMRGEKSGTWRSDWQKTADDTAVITQSKRVRE